MRPMRLLTTQCRRCGRPLVTGETALLPGTAEAKARLDRICERCVTPEERAEILAAQTAGAAKLAGAE